MPRMFFIASLLLSFTMMGCNSGDPSLIPGRSRTFPVTGTILLDGVPVENATVMFFCKKLRITSYGKTDSTGQYELTTYEPGDGAPEGHYVVTVKKLQQTITETSDNPALPPKSETVQLLPPQYADFEKSPLKAVIASDGNNTFQFNLSP